ncbi:MAG: tetratricopeptide repeat protein [Candidatus Zixiibacteriota bacterium]|nr:MAG: tetratricopeptide repeat protein [candidate division Zixibacteria bacterium]
MFESPDDTASRAVDLLAEQGHWPALAARYLEEGRYSRAVEICKEHLPEESGPLSGRLVYGRALFHAGQTETAVEQFYHVLSRDPQNVAALKYLGDVLFVSGDVPAALASYRRVLEIDPDSRVLALPLKAGQRETTRTITIGRPHEGRQKAAGRCALRDVYFCTETIGDLYLAQGYPGMAAEVYRTLNSADQNPRLREKLARAETQIKEKEDGHVKKAD